jgi:spoIIIJ-associated protein
MSEPDEDEAPAEILQDLLEEIVDGLGLEARVSVSEGGGVLAGNVDGEDLGLLIGRRGQTIDAVQHLAQRTVFRGARGELRIVVDAGGYRARRAQALADEADEAADRAVLTGQPVSLEPMPASERRVVHEHLRERGDVETHSEGEEPERYLVIGVLPG